jgi:hypothetical protein
MRRDWDNFDATTHPDAIDLCAGIDLNSDLTDGMQEF